MEPGGPHSSADREEAARRVAAARETFREQETKVFQGRRQSMRTTFYIASPFGNFPQVRQFADFLIEKGWRWANNHNWTLERFTEARPMDHPFWPSWAVGDMKAAMAADVFVLLLAGKTTAGAHAEFGARWGAGRSVHAIRQDGERHLFHTLPGIVWHDTVEDFLSHMFSTS